MPKAGDAPGLWHEIGMSDLTKIIVQRIVRYDQNRPRSCR